MAESVKKMVGNLALVLFLGLTVSLGFQSCKKEKPPKAEVTIVDSTGTAIKEAKVVLFCVQRPEVSTECNVADTQYTDGVGKANFEFENPAVLRVFIQKFNTVERDTGTFPNIGTVVVGDTLCADGFITLKVNEVTEERYVLGNCEN